jgi:DNA-binding GntR family transcriptional regulator
MKSILVATPLQRDLVRRIARRLTEQPPPPGARIAEPGLARAFGVSRTPVRAALLELERQGVLRHQARRGFVLLRPPDLPPPEPDLADRILAARAGGALPRDVSESSLMAAHGATRGAVRRALMRLGELGLVRRAAGHGWQFAPALEDARARAESLAFRLAIEPASLRQPGWQAPPGLLDRLEDQQRRLLGMRGGSAQEWARANEAFHAELAACSGNRFMAEAVQAQNALRRLNEVTRFPALTAGRIRQSCHEHLAILAALRQGNRRRAAALMREHLAAAGDPA